MPNSNLDAYVASMIEIGADATPAPDGSPDNDAWGAMQAVLDEMDNPMPDVKLAIDEETFGSEAPGPGWEYAGEGRWTRPGGRPRSEPREATNPKVGIIGGGPGGLFAAYILGQRCPDCDIILFEASHRLGGKIVTGKFSDGTPFESGVAELYEYKGPGGRDSMRWLIEDDLGLRTVNMSGGGVVLHGKPLLSVDDLPAKVASEVHAFHERMVELMPIGRYATRWQPDNKHPWAPRTFRECIREEVKSPEARNYIETAVHSDLATESHTCNGLNGIKNVLLDNDAYMQLYHIKGGIDRVVEELTSRVKAEVRLNHRAVKIAPTGGKSYMLDYQAEGTDRTEELDAVIISLPNHWLSQLAWGDETMASAIHSVLAHYDLPAHYFRVSMLFGKPWWEKFKLPGDFWMMDCFHGLCCYDESARWRRGPADGHVLSFLLAGQDALLMCSHNGDDVCIAKHLLDSLPADWRGSALENLLEVQIDSYVGSVNAQPGGYPAAEIRGQHQPEKKGHPGVFLVGDYIFDSTLNATLISAGTAVSILGTYLGKDLKKGTPAIESLDSDRAFL